jgi:two-component system invasion response regulator UvrY
MVAAYDLWPMAWRVSFCYPWLANTGDTVVLNVLVLDDHPVIRQGLRRHLLSTGDVTICAEAAMASEVLAHLEQHSCDVVLMDLTLGRTYGLDVVSSIKALRPHVPIVIYSLHEHRAYVRSAFLRGVIGYVSKTGPLSEIVTALRYAVNGIRYVSPSLEQVPACPVGLAAKPLSERQQQILTLRGKGHTAPQIGVALGISVKTVSAHEEKILEKLELCSRHQLLQYAARQALQ